MEKEKSVIRIGILMEGAHKLNTGIGEFQNSIAVRLAQRAPMLKQKYGIRLCFIMTKGHNCENFQQPTTFLVNSE